MVEPTGDEVETIVEAWRRERPDIDVGSIGILTPVWRIASIAMERRARILAGHGLDQSHLDVLVTLRLGGPPYRLSAGELSRRCRVTPGATTQRVQAMEGLGLVARVREEPDRRTVHVQLTADGSSRLDAIIADVMAGDDALLAGLEPAQRAALEELLRSWLRSLAGGGMRDEARGLTP